MARPQGSVAKGKAQPPSSSYPIVPDHLRVYTFEEDIPEDIPVPRETSIVAEESAIVSRDLQTSALNNATAVQPKPDNNSMAATTPLQDSTDKFDEDTVSHHGTVAIEHQDRMRGPGYDSLSSPGDIDPASTIPSKGVAAAKAKVTFLDLPFELRLIIYRYIASIKLPCGLFFRGQLTSCSTCKDRATTESSYIQLFAPECHQIDEDFSDFLRKKGSMCLVNGQVDAEYLQYVVPHYSLTLRFDLQTFRFTNCANGSPNTGYEQPADFEHRPLPGRFAEHLKQCDVFLCENRFYNGQSMANLMVALGGMPNLKFVRLHWARVCKADPGKKDNVFRAVRHLKLEEGAWTGLSPSIDVASLPDVELKECQELYESFC